MDGDSCDVRGVFVKIKKNQTVQHLLKKSGHRSSATSTILEWLDGNYYIVPGACMARSVLYEHYKFFCQNQARNPQSPASFGKVVRIKFPSLTTRRLGTRGQSKYHYFGLGIKECSIYFKGNTIRKGITRFTNKSASSDTVNNVISSRLSATSLKFPCFNNIMSSETLPMLKLETFMLMYRSHCQRVYDSVSRRNFHEVKEFLVHFWNGMPSHMLSILETQVILDVIVVYDSILYNSLCDTLIPDSLTTAPGSCLDSILTFSRTLIDWLVHLLAHLPECVCNVKVQAAEMFGKSLKRLINLLQLAKRFRYILGIDELTSIALSDLLKIDKSCLCHQIKKITLKTHRLNNQEIVLEFLENLEHILVKPLAAIEDYFLIIDGMLYKHVLKICSSNNSFKIDLLYDFFLLWNCFASCVEVEMITMTAKSQGTFGIIFLFLTEYIVYIKELVQSKLIEERYLSSLSAKGSNSEDHCVADYIRPHLPSQKHVKTDTSSTTERERPTYLSLVVCGILPNSSSSSSSCSPLSNSSSINSPFLYDYVSITDDSSDVDSPSLLQIDFDASEDDSIDNDFPDFDNTFHSSSSKNMSDFLQVLESTDKLLADPFNEELL